MMRLGQQTSISGGAIVTSRLVRLSSALAAYTILISLAPAVEVKQLAAAAHAYPSMHELSGKKIADGEFRQELRDGLLQVKISYRFADRNLIEESATFQQTPELIQREWSWRELRDGKLQRTYKVQFDRQTATAEKTGPSGMEHWTEQLQIDNGHTFAGFGFVLALTNLRERLVKGEQIELKAVGFNPKPRVVSVQLSYKGEERMEMGGREIKGAHFVIRPQIPAIAKVFVKVTDTNIWLTASEPSGFLRWEGPLAEPGDKVVRVDLVPGDISATARPAAAVNRMAE